jgi:hypothetical protein
MGRKLFLTLVAMIAVVVGLFALVAPAALLASKGVAASAAGELWAREMGVAILSSGVAAGLMRGHADSASLRAFLIANAVLQIGLFPIEIAAYAAGVVTKASGIVPNEVLHLVLASGFVHFALRIKRVPPAAA